MLQETPYIPEHEIQIHTARSGGPGGQNVNKVETKVVLRWRVGSSSAFTDDEKRLILLWLGPRVNKAGEVVIHVSRERSQAQNRAFAITFLHELVAQALRPVKRRIPTRPTRGSVVVRREEKKIRTRKKAVRRLARTEAELL